LYWQFCFYPHHGSLKEFYTSIRPSEYSGGTEVKLIQPRHGGTLFKVDRRPSNDKFSAALESWDAAKAAEQLVALLVSTGSIDAMSTNVLQTYVKHIAKTSITSINTKVLMDEDENIGGESTDDDPVSKIVHFYLRVLAAIPAWGTLQATLAPIILIPLRDVMSAVGGKWPMEIELFKYAGNNSKLRQTVVNIALGAGPQGVLKISPILDNFWENLNQHLAVSSIVVDQFVCEQSIDVVKLQAKSITTLKSASDSQRLEGDTLKLSFEADDPNESVKMAVEDSSAKAVVEEIRNEFIGDLKSKTMEHLRSALERISCDLYSEESHFVSTKIIKLFANILCSVS